MNETFEQGGKTYHWVGGFGAIFQSRERGKDLGDMRMIGGEAFYVFMIERSRIRPRISRALVSWTTPDVDVELIRRLKRKFFGIEPVRPPAPHGIAQG